MEADRAIEIVQSLADGVDPFSGERFPSGSPYQQADTVRALHLALEGLTKLRRSTSRKTGPGRSWTEDEEQELLREFDAKLDLSACDAQAGVEEIAAKHERTKGAICARLEILGRIQRTFVYDPATLALVSEQLPGGEVLSRTTDVFGRPAGLALGQDYAVTYGYDSAGRFGSVTTSAPLAPLAVQYGYVQGSDLLAGWSSNVGMSFQRTFEANRDLIASVTNAWNGAAVSSFAYTNDELGRRTTRTDNGSVTNLFGYNPRSEVTSALMGANAFGYQYDPIGNRLTATNNAAVTTYAANELNQYTNVVAGASVTPTYDDDGNMTAYGPWAFAWDGENRLIGVTSNSVAVASNVYDYASRRVVKTTQGVTRGYQYDGWNLIRETAGTNVTQYVWGLDLSQTLQGAGGVGGLLSVAVAGGGDPGRYFPAYDANGNVTDYVNSSGSIVARYEYDPFGGMTYQTGTLAEQFVYRFSTKYWDAETALYYYGYRYYSPELGRWVNRDPIGERGGRNLMANMLNNTPNKVDIHGLMGVDSSHEENTCGPDVTKFVTDALNRVKDEFREAHICTKFSACYRGLRTHEAANGWDIKVLNEVGHGNTQRFVSPGGGLGKLTVAYKGRCYPAHAVNYLLWGTANRLCYDRFGSIMPPMMPISLFGLSTTIGAVNWHKISMAFINALNNEMGEAKGYIAGLPSACAFTTAGYTGSDIGLSAFSLPFTVDPANIYEGDTEKEWHWIHLKQYDPNAMGH